MEEQGIEVAIQPGTDTDLLQYCITEATHNIRSNEEEVIPTESAKCATVEENTTSAPSRLVDEEQRQEDTTDRASLHEQKEQPPVEEEVNRHDSLVESDSDDDDESNTDDYENDHPALKTTVYNEGQEAVWHEDDYSTISSAYYVKPEKEAIDGSSQKQKKKIKIPFFKSRGKKAQKEEPIVEETEPAPRPVKIHIKKNNGALLPPKSTEKKEENADEEIIDCEKLMRENDRYASITENSVQARRLLDTALSGDGLDEEESMRLTKEAFNHATAARRLADDIAENDDECEEAIELENIMSQLAEEGEYAALQHRQQYSMDEEDDVQEGGKYSNAIDLTMVDAEETSPTSKKQQEKFPVSVYASRAVHYLESILPKNFVAPDNASASEESGISTLGLKNDTLEYELDADEGDDEHNDAVNQERTVLPRTADMMSLSSLNEILDGNGTVTQKERHDDNKDILNEETKRRQNSITDSSPRATVREIGIPRKKTDGLPPTHPRQKSSGILGLITPQIPKPSIFFRTPRANKGVPSQLDSDSEELDESEEFVEQIQGDADSCVDMPEENRYTPAFDDDESKAKVPDRYAQHDEIQANLSVTTDNSQTEARYDEDLSGDDVTPQSSVQEEVDASSPEDEGEAPVEEKEAKLDMPFDNKNIEDYENQDRYQTEPVGKTPKRDGLELEANTDRKFEEENMEVALEEQDKKEVETVQDDTKGNEQKETEKDSSDENPACDSSRVVNSSEESAPVKHEATPVESAEENSPLGRAVDMVGQNKRKPLIPNAVVEEKYLVDKDMKKISNDEGKAQKLRNPAKTKRDLRKPVSASKASAARRAAISQMKNIPASPPFIVVDDSSTVVREAISKGALMAVESNEKGDDVVPTNYLSSMLKEKLRMENTPDSVELNQQRSLDERQDADSYVAAIRGPRPKEAPGVALEEAAIRNYKNNRDPSVGDGINSVVVDLAPTPRRPKGPSYRFDDQGEKVKEKAHDIAMKEEEEERQRRKMITERLFKAGSSSFEGAQGILKEVPTVASAESYCDEPVQESAEQNANKELIEKIDGNSRTKVGHGRRRLTIAFLKAKRK